MNEIDLKSITAIISSFVALLLALFILSVKSNNKISNRLFSVFLMLTAIEISGFYLNFFVTISHRINSVINLLYYLLTPTFYLYVCSVCYSNFKLKWKHVLHLLPFIIGNIVMIPRFYFGEIEEVVALNQNIILTFELIFTHVTMHIQSLCYYIASFVVVKQAKNIFTENFSNNAIETYKWLYQIVLFWFAVFIIATIKNIFKYLGYKDVFLSSQVLLSVSLLIMVCWYVLKALRNPDLFRGVDSKIILTEKLIKTSKYSITDEKVQKLKDYMIKNEPYLNPSLSIRSLADEMKTPMRELSVLINQNLNKHFFDFVNEYRIKKAMNHLEDSSNDQLTILEILYQVGFNSKSSFNTAFKKYTKLTPTQYRKSYKK